MTYWGIHCPSEGGVSRDEGFQEGVEASIDVILITMLVNKLAKSNKLEVTHGFKGEHLCRPRCKAVSAAIRVERREDLSYTHYPLMSSSMNALTWIPAFL